MSLTVSFLKQVGRIFCSDYWQRADWCRLRAVVSETHLWRGLPYALLSCTIAVFFRVYEDVNDRTLACKQ
eukprot:3840718-Amphidinium_carterae.1